MPQALMADLDDDVPLVKPNRSMKSAAQIPNGVDKAMDKKIPSTRETDPGVSIRNGPVRPMGVASAHVNGVDVNGKRKARPSAVGAKYKEESDSDDEIPLAKKRKTGPAKVQSDSDSDVPLVKAKKPPKVTPSQIGEKPTLNGSSLTRKLSKDKASIEKQAAKEAQKIRASDLASARKKRPKEEDSDDDVPLVQNKKTSIKRASANDAPKGSKAATPKSVKKEDPSPKKAKAKALEEQHDEEEAEAEAEEEEYNWWEDRNPRGDGTRKWDTLQHGGVMFPPPYEPLPKTVKLVYDGKPVSLKPEAEEIAVFYGSMLHSTTNTGNPTFNKNFFEDFKEVLDKTGHATDKDGNKIKIKSFEKCDFKRIHEHFEADRAAKKALPAAQKKAIKEQKEQDELPFKFCKWDGKKQKVGNFRVEPPGLFRGRGQHPKTGRVKKRVLPEQITLNIGEDAVVPAAPAGHKWKDVRHDHTGTWLAMWQENVNGQYKYVMLSADSDIKGKSDLAKFDKARDLKKHIDQIRQDYQRELKSEVMADRQRATAMYLIDQFALRAGNEKGEDEADTVGCCSLKFEHITLQPPQTVAFDFLGKDSIRFHEEFDVDRQVFKNLAIFKKAPKTNGDEIFDRLTTSSLNKHLQSYMPGLTAKVFRTYNASQTMSNLLRDLKSTGTIPEKVKDYNDANRKVAILCNHKRTVAAGHAGQMEKLEDKINGLRYQVWRAKQMILAVEPKEKKRRGAEYFALPKDLNQEWVEKHQAALVEEERQKIEKKFNKENEKLAADGAKEMKPKELQDRLVKVKELERKFKAENRSKKIEPEGKGPSVEKYEQQIEKLNGRIETMKIQGEDKENNKEVALGTSKINYIDPRLTVVFSKKYGVPIERFFSKTLREKFAWAIDMADETWEF